MSINNIIERFDCISLVDMDSVKLMNRTDQKYWFNAEHLEEILSDIERDYYVLEIDGERNMSYSTIYYDTESDDMYNNHHRGKLNRFKIRRRSYDTTGSSFLEIKFKSNKGRTIKERLLTEYNSVEFNDSEKLFITENCPYNDSELREVLFNRFRRVMLVSKDRGERCTIDQSLFFRGKDIELELGSLVIVEVKRGGRERSSMVEALHRRRIKSSGFSKYCIGRSITYEGIKTNNFKLKHRLIQKVVGNLL